MNWKFSLIRIYTIVKSIEIILVIILQILEWILQDRILPLNPIIEGLFFANNTSYFWIFIMLLLSSFMQDIRPITEMFYMGIGSVTNLMLSFCFVYFAIRDSTATGPYIATATLSFIIGIVMAIDTFRRKIFKYSHVTDYDLEACFPLCVKKRDDDDFFETISDDDMPGTSIFDLLRSSSGSEEDLDKERPERREKQKRPIKKDSEGSEGETSHYSKAESEISLDVIHRVSGANKGKSNETAKKASETSINKKRHATVVDNNAKPTRRKSFETRRLSTESKKTVILVDVPMIKPKSNVKVLKESKPVAAIVEEHKKDDTKSILKPVTPKTGNEDENKPSDSAGTSKDATKDNSKKKNDDKTGGQKK